MSMLCSYVATIPYTASYALHMGLGLFIFCPQISNRLLRIYRLYMYVKELLDDKPRR